MTEDLLFPGGVVRVDQSLVWRKLAAWIHEQADFGDVRLREAAGKYRCTLTAEHGKSYEGTSRLSVADAVAQALQVAEAAK